MRAYIQKHPDQTLVIVYVVLFAVGFVFLVSLLWSIVIAFADVGIYNLNNSFPSQKYCFLFNLVTKHCT
jgi:hypothetical protein